MANSPEISIEYVRQCFDRNETGDGELFARLFRDRFVCNEDSERWLEYNGSYWDYVQPGRIGMAIEQCDLQYCRLLEQAYKKDACEKKKKVTEQGKKNEDRTKSGYVKDLERRVERLHSVRGKEHTLKQARDVEDPLAVFSNQFDTYPMLLAVENGVIDLETGALKAGNPRDYLMRHCSCPYLGNDQKAPRWEKFLDEIFQGDAEKIDFFQTILGYALTGLTSEHYLFCLTGAGANGKSVLMETLHEVLGEFFWTADPDIFLDRNYAKQGGSPNPEMASLRGRRFVAMQEIEPGRKVHVSAVKRLTGSDTIVCRSPYDRFEVNFKPTAKFFLSFNDRPKGLARDFAMLRRLIYIDFPLRFVKDPEHEKRRDPPNAALYRLRDPELQEKLVAEKPGILAALVRHCLKWQKHGLHPPASVLDAVEKIAKDEDWIGRFLEDVCDVVPEGFVEIGLFYETFSVWWKNEVDENPNRIPSKRWVADQLRKRGFVSKRSNSITRFFGLQLSNTCALTPEHA